MSRKLQDILDSLPGKPPHSRLEPYRALIGELRRRKRTYREIVSILAEKCDLHVSVSTLHDFVRLRSRAALKHPRATRPRNVGSQMLPHAKLRPEESSPTDDVQRRISALRERAAPTERHPSQRFDYDPNEPLRLPKQTREP